MADEHRRVEPRGIVGSGMLTDPERVEQLEHDRDRRERAWREAPKRKFGEVLEEAPARAPEDDEREQRDQRRRNAKADDTKAREADEDDAKAASAPAPVDVTSDQPLPRVPPDPRMARLQAMLAPKPKPQNRDR